MQEREMECKEWREGGDLEYSEERCHLDNLGDIQENSGMFLKTPGNIQVDYGEGLWFKFRFKSKL